MKRLCEIFAVPRRWPVQLGPATWRTVMAISDVIPQVMLTVIVVLVALVTLLRFLATGYPVVLITANNARVYGILIK